MKIRSLAIVIICAMASGCANIGIDNSALSSRFAQQAMNVVPVASYYDVGREQHYPLSSEANMYVAGEDDQLVAQFIAALEHHFQYVSAVDEGRAVPAHTGFVLNVKAMDGERNQSVDSESGAVQDAQRFRVTVSDIDRGQVFDSVTIKLKRQSLWLNDSTELRDHAFKDAAAKLAGDS